MMNPNEEMIYSNEETIGIVEQRKLRELETGLAKMLTHEEFMCIVAVYNCAINRLLGED